MTSDRARPVYTWWNVVHLRNEGLAAGQENKTTTKKRINKRQTRITGAFVGFAVVTSLL